jgi:transcriptional regulator with XRE-family HTH domain
MGNTIGKRIKELREEKGITTIELAEKSGVAQSTISQIENGKRNPSTGTAAKIAEALGVSITKILNGSDAPEKDELIVSNGEQPPDVFTFDDNGIRIFTPKDFAIKGKKRTIIISTRVTSNSESAKESFRPFPEVLEEAVAKRIIHKFLKENKKKIVDEINQSLIRERKKLQEIFKSKEEESYLDNNHENNEDGGGGE